MNNQRCCYNTDFLQVSFGDRDHLSLPAIMLSRNFLQPIENKTFTCTFGFCPHKMHNLKPSVQLIWIFCRDILYFFMYKMYSYSNKNTYTSPNYVTMTRPVST